MRKLPIGGLEFREIIEGDYLYVDKTPLLNDVLWRTPCGVFLFTRPRRFGKTLTISMMEEFFDIRRKGTTAFDGLEISKPEYSWINKHRNAYNVIRLDLKNTKGHTMEEFIDGFREALSVCFRKHLDILENLEMDSVDRADVNKILNKTASNLDVRYSLHLLSELLYDANGLETVILIDEYDAAVSCDMNVDNHDEIIRIITRMMLAALKGNEYLQFAAVTGTERITGREWLDSLNNITINHILVEQTNNRFGFTESEVKAILDEAGHPEMLPKIREWYGGYDFCGVEMYNPFSVINYVNDGCDEPRPYPMSSSVESMVKELTLLSNKIEITAPIKFLQGTPLSGRIDMNDILGDIDRDLYGIYSILAMNGCLSAHLDDDYRGCELRTPNNEVRATMKKAIWNANSVDAELFSRLCDAVGNNKPEAISGVLEQIILNSITCEGFRLGHVMTVIVDGVSKYCDMRMDDIRYDTTIIVLQAKDERYPSLIFDLEGSYEQCKLPEVAEHAMRQIHEKRCYADMTGNVLLIGLSYCKGACHLRSEIINMERDWEKLRPASDD